MPKPPDSPLRRLHEKYREYTAGQVLRAIPWDREPPLPDPAQTSAKEFFAALRRRI